MNTLSKKMTAIFFNDADGYERLVQRWSALVATKESLSPAEHAIYAVLRGKDWRAGFTPIKNAVKLTNGAAIGISAITKLNAGVLRSASYDLFEELITDQAEGFVNILLRQNPQFVNVNTLPSEAYDNAQILAVFGAELLQESLDAVEARQDQPRIAGQVAYA